MEPVAITEDKLETGLRGVPAGYCPTSEVDPDKGLSYGGYFIRELAQREPVEVIYLLLHRQLPNKTEIADFRKELLRRSTLPAGLEDYLRTLPRQGHPMKWFASGLLYLGMTGCTGNYREDCLNLIAWAPELAAKVIAVHQGRAPAPARPELGYMENFVHILNPDADRGRLTRLMRVFDVLHFDHDGGNLSTFTGKAVASGLEDMYGSITAAMLGLAGPRHGMANQECLDFIMKLHEELKGRGDDEAGMRRILETRYANKDLIYGFGHAVLRVEDPRAAVLFELGEELCPADPYFRTAQTLRKVGTAFLKTKDKISDPYVNVDAASGALLHACGLKEQRYYTVLFGLSRVVGISIQIVYERLEARGGKGTPIMRPRYLYSGPVRG